MTYEICNARIQSTFLGIEDHGFLSYFINLQSGGGTIQGWGGYILGTRKGKSTGLAGDLLLHLLGAIEVDKWEALTGRPCRVLREHRTARALGNLLEDRWVWISESGVHTGTEQEARESLGITQ